MMDRRDRLITLVTWLHAPCRSGTLDIPFRKVRAELLDATRFVTTRDADDGYIIKNG
jgi:hypothetical protein